MTPSGGVGPLPGFEVAVRYSADGEEVVVATSGEVDLVTAPHLGAVAAAVTGRGPARVVLDLSGVTFMGAAGLGIIAASAEQLAPGGGRLVLRAPSHLVRRMLEITGLDGVAEVEEPKSAPSHLGAEQPASALGAPAVPPSRTGSRTTCGG